MIKYHGTPISPYNIFNEYMKNRNTLISFSDKRDINRAVEICDKVIIDNGAFSVWKKGISIDWNRYYEFVYKYHDKIELFFIPDVIDGTDEENDNMIEYYENNWKCKINKGVPVWHLGDSLERLNRLSNRYDYIAFGSSGKYKTLGTQEWHSRVEEAMDIICDNHGYPKVKIHMLRCLNHRIFSRYPFYSGDSTSFAQNHNAYNKKYIDTDIDGRQYLLNNLSRYNSPNKFNRRISG